MGGEDINRSNSQSPNNLLTRHDSTKIPPPFRKGTQARAPSTDAKVGGRTVLSAAVGPRRYRPIPQGQDPQGGGRQVLVMQGRKETDPSPPFCGVQGLAPSDQRAVEGDRKHPRAPLAEGPLGGEGHGGGFEVPEGHQGGVYQHQKEASGGGMRWAGRGRGRGRERGGQAVTAMSVSPIPLLLRGTVFCFVLFVLYRLFITRYMEPKGLWQRPCRLNGGFYRYTHFLSLGDGGCRGGGIPTPPPP